MAEALFIPGHIQRPGAWLRHRRHDDRRGSRPLDRGPSPQLPDVRVAERAESLRGGELMKRLLPLLPLLGLVACKPPQIIIKSGFEEGTIALHRSSKLMAAKQDDMFAFYIK